MSTSKSERDQAIDKLRAILAPGTTVYTVVRHVSASGMSRSISLVIAGEDRYGQVGIEDITWLVGRVLDYRRQDDGGLRVSGAGMDMGWHLVHELGYAIWPAGFACIGDRCPASDHRNGDTDYTVGHQHGARSGGYALRHEAL